MKNVFAGLLALGSITLSGVAAHAADLTGKLGLNYTVGPSFVAGGSGANDASRVGPQVGAGAEYGLTKNIAATFNYDDLDVGFQSQALTFGATFRPMPQNALSPFFNAALGFGHRYSDDGWDHFALKFTGGVEHHITENVSLAALLSYFYIPGSADHNGIGDVHVFEPGLRMSFYFGPYK
jgi:opacity protein-like surface antigen